MRSNNLTTATLWMGGFAGTDLGHITLKSIVFNKRAMLISPCDGLYYSSHEVKYIYLTFQENFEGRNQMKMVTTEYKDKWRKLLSKVAS